MNFEGKLADFSCTQRVHFKYQGEVCVFHDLYTRFCNPEEEIASRWKLEKSVIFATSVPESNCVCI